MYKTILVPLDGSECAEAILPHVEELAGNFGSTLVLLQVVDRISQSISSLAVYLSKEDVQAEHKKAEAYLEAEKQRLEQKGIRVMTSILYGPAVDAIIKTAEDENADLVAMGSHGRSGISRAFYGSVAAGVLQRIDRPLLLVRP